MQSYFTQAVESEGWKAVVGMKNLLCRLVKPYLSLPCHDDLILLPRIIHSMQCRMPQQQSTQCPAGTGL